MHTANLIINTDGDETIVQVELNKEQLKHLIKMAENALNQFK